MRSYSFLTAAGLAATTASTCLAGFTSDTYVDLAMASTNGDFNLFNDYSMNTGGSGYTFLGGTSFGQSSLDYTIGLSTIPGSSGIVGGSLGETDVVDFSITIENTSGQFHFYTLFISTGITTPWDQGTLVEGDLIGNLIELGPTTGEFDMTNNGDNPLMQGLIDNVGVLDVGPPAPWGISASPGGTTFISASAGVGPTNIDSSYGVILSFGLAGDDSVTINGAFRVTYVPGPASILALAVGAAAGRRRRRN